MRQSMITVWARKPFLRSGGDRNMVLSREFHLSPRLKIFLRDGLFCSPDTKSIMVFVLVWLRKAGSGLGSTNILLYHLS